LPCGGQHFERAENVQDELRIFDASAQVPNRQAFVTRKSLQCRNDTGQAIFQNETLIQAAQEMNRYSTVRLVIADPRIEGLKISGVYRVGDNRIFAVALASLLPVLIRLFDDRIEIIGDDKKLDKV
jgi:ferric-dicitrate binding protein FerR (iron transport regulator)